MMGTLLVKRWEDCVLQVCTSNDHTSQKCHYQSSICYCTEAIDRLLKHKKLSKLLYKQLINDVIMCLMI